MIITGCQDSLIRIWEPYVSKKPTNILRSHNNSIVHLIIDERDNTLISIDKSQSKNKSYLEIKVFNLLDFALDIFIWYLISSKILQKLLVSNEYNFKNQEISCVYFNIKMQKLILFNKNKLTAFEHANEVFLNHDRSSHSRQVLCIIYNSLFDTLISADSSSVINVWDVTTGLIFILNDIYFLLFDFSLF